MAAPALLAGTVALTLLFNTPPAASLLGPGAAAVNGFLKLIQSAMISFSLPVTLSVILLWPFLEGGILDRYARNRPTRGRGFFGACGAHFGAMVRLAVLAWLMYGAIVLWLGRGFGGGVYGRGAVIALTLAAGLVVSYARIRLVVEDRRSALGSLLAGARFIRRNPMTAGVLFLVYLLLIAALDRFGPPAAIAPGTAGWRAYLGAQTSTAVRCVFVLALYASQIALFQSRLAHASYTAAPPIEWPESPAAESITNAPPAVPS